MNKGQFLSHSDIVIGRFGKPFGIKGWIKVHSFTDPPENILLYHPWKVGFQKDWQEIEISDGKIHGKDILIKLANCDNPEEAKLYTQKEIAIDHSQLPKLAKDEYYWSDLENMSVINKEGIELGRLSHFIPTGANDVMVVKGKREYLIPYISSVVISVNPEAQEIVVDWDENF